jgi:hypothetical protein
MADTIPTKKLSGGPSHLALGFFNVRSIAPAVPVAPATPPIVQADLGGVNAAEVVIKAERPAPYSRPGSERREATRRAHMTVTEANEHVLALDAPVVGKGPLDAAADCPGGDGVVDECRDEPVAASGRDGGASIYHPGTEGNERRRHPWRRLAPGRTRSRAGP